MVWIWPDIGGALILIISKYIFNEENIYTHTNLKYRFIHCLCITSSNFNLSSDGSENSYTNLFAGVLFGGLINSVLCLLANTSTNLSTVNTDTHEQTRWALSPALLDLDPQHHRPNTQSWSRCRWSEGENEDDEDDDARLWSSI